jgi:hypothetical protein
MFRLRSFVTLVERTAKLIHKDEQSVFIHLLACLCGNRTPVSVFGNWGHMEALLLGVFP